MAVTIKDAGINVQIVRETRSPTQQGFGAIGFLSPIDGVTERIKLYTSIESLAVDYPAGTEPYAAALSFYSQTPVPSDFYVIQADLAETPQEALDAAVLVNPNFYCIATDKSFRTDEAEITEIAAWTEANERLFFTTTNDATVLDGAADTDIASQLLLLGYQRTYVHYSSQVDQYPDTGAFAILATTSFRGTDTLKTLKFKDVVGITSEDLTPAGLQAIRDKNCNVLFSTAGIRMVDAGRTVAGGWIDEIHGADALAEQIRVNVFGLMSRISTKVPYTESGMSQIKYEVETALTQFVTNGYLAAAVDEEGSELPAYTITSALVLNAPQADKSARIAPDVEFTARLAGAVHNVLINGTLVL